MCTKEYCDIFNDCYPQFRMSCESFEGLILKEAEVIEHSDNEKICGFVVYKNSAIRLICVRKEERNKGVGTILLKLAESAIRGNGFDKAITGGVSSRFIIGADERAWPFFEKNGYVSVGQCDEMLMELKKFDRNMWGLHGGAVAEYGWYEGDIKTLHNAVEKVDKEWVQYFNEKDRIYVGMVGEELASFCLVDMDAKNYLSDSYGRVGVPGCVGCIPKFRNKGIALEMVARATEYLRDKGMDISFIFFTGVADWYKKIGYETFMTEIFGEKVL